jgi:hypothetical protein
VISKFAAMPFLVGLLAHLDGGEMLSTTSAGRRYRGRVSTLDPKPSMVSVGFAALDLRIARTHDLYTTLRDMEAPAGMNTCDK